MADEKYTAEDQAFMENALARFFGEDGMEQLDEFHRQEFGHDFDPYEHDEDDER